MEQIAPRKLDEWELCHEQLGEELFICLGKILVETKHPFVLLLIAAGAGTGTN